MNKAIVILTGTPPDKNKFMEVARKQFWVRNANPKDNIMSVAKKYLLYPSEQERNEEYHKFSSKFILFLDGEYDFQERYITETVQRFISDDREYFENETGSKFTNMVLLVHGASPSIKHFLKTEYSAIQIHVTERSLNTDGERYDTVIYSDDKDFEEQCLRTLHILTGGR